MQRRCPNCGGFNVRRSVRRPTDRGSILHRIFASPYRCRDCETRFIVTSSRAVNLAWILTAALIMGVVIWRLPPAAEHTDPAARAAANYAEVLKRADKGDKDAEYDVSQMLAVGDGVEKNNEAAQRYRLRAAEHGVLAAQYDLGLALSDGRAALQDYEPALKWMEKAAMGGHLQAQYQLGRMYLSGKGVQADNIKAYAWLNVAAAHGVSEAARDRDAVFRKLSPSEAITAQAEARRLSGLVATPPPVRR